MSEFGFTKHEMARLLGSEAAEDDSPKTTFHNPSSGSFLKQTIAAARVRNA
jgi:hypothetical protein